MSSTPALAPARIRRWSAVLPLALSLPLLGAAPAVGATPAGQAAALAAVPQAAALATAQSSGQSLRVASFNIRCANCSRNSRTNGREKNWETRRNKVISQIKSEQVDVVGLQEASPGILKGTKISQFEDLTNRLGGSYRLANDKRYGCAKSTSYKNCTKSNNGASADVRIVYKSSRLTLLNQGSRQLDSEKATSGPRFVSWAVFRDRVTKREFFFVTAHTEPGQSKATRALRARQAAKIVAEIKAHNSARRPLVLTGDFSSSKLTIANPVYDVVMKSGLVIDPLGNTHKMKSTSQATAKKLINIKYDTLNNFKSRPTTHKGYALGAHLDYIFTSRSIRVSEYKVVVDLKSNGQFSGVIPSDHNMVRATITLA